jgi:hypothetical protein
VSVWTLCRRKVTHLLPLPGIEARFLWRQAYSLVTTDYAIVAPIRSIINIAVVALVVKYCYNWHRRLESVASFHVSRYVQTESMTRFVMRCLSSSSVLQEKILFN